MTTDRRMPSRLHSIERREVMVVTVAEGRGDRDDVIYEATYVYDVETGILLGSAAYAGDDARPVDPPTRIDGSSGKARP